MVLQSESCTLCRHAPPYGDSGTAAARIVASPRIAVADVGASAALTSGALDLIGEVERVREPPEPHSPHDLIVLGSFAAPKLFDYVLRYRSAGDWTPLVVITDREDSVVRAKLLVAGADECTTGTLSTQEFVARIRALLRRAAVTRRESRFGVQVLVEADCGLVVFDGVRAQLTETQLALFTHLLAHAETWVNAESLLSILSTGHHRDSALVRVHVCETRRKLGAASWRLQSRPRSGYRVTLAPRDDD